MANRKQITPTECAAIRAIIARPSSTDMMPIPAKGAWQRAEWKRREHASNPNCHYCGQKTGIGSVYREREATVDHVVALARGGKDCPSNYVLACSLCNGAKGSGKFTLEKRRAALAKRLLPQ